MTILVKKVFISSKPTFVYLLCPPLCGPFSIQESAAGGLSYKGKKEDIHTGYPQKASTRRDSNPRPSPWQGDTPPLSHSCKICCAVTVSATKHMIPENGTFVNRYFLSFRSFHFHSGSAGCPHTYCLGNLFPECCPVSGIPGQTTALLRSPAYVPVQYLHQRD